jgi:hypothetical protein
MEALKIVSDVVTRLKAEGVFYSDDTQNVMDRALEVVAEELGTDTHTFEVDLAMHEGGYSDYEEAEEYVGANGLWDCIEPLASFENIWERLSAKNTIDIEIKNNFFTPKTRDILIAVINKSNQLITNDF